MLSHQSFPKQILILLIILFSSCQENKPVAPTLTEKSKKEKVVSEKQPLKKTETKVKQTQKEYVLGNVKIQLIQDKAKSVCKSEIVISKEGVELNKVKFLSEPVGGNFGISKGTQINDHFIFTKHGDYNGRTLVINEEGKLFDIIGGENFYDSTADLLFTIYESDMPGFAVFDLKADTMMLTMEGTEEQPISMHKDEGRYFMIGISQENDDKSIWEFEFDMGRIMQVDLDENNINSKNILQQILVEYVDCVCGK